MRIREVVLNKGSVVVTVAPTATVRELVALLHEHNVGALVVSSDGHAVEGIVSERDVVRHLHTTAGLLDDPVASIMTANVSTCEPDATLEDLARLMTNSRIRHVPVVVDAQLVGIVSIGDVVKSRISELEFERSTLQDYITSG
jgi:CBS domain-containing protein